MERAVPAGVDADRGGGVRRPPPRPPRWLPAAESGILGHVPAPRALRALAHRDFRLFWGGQCVSLVGTWMQSVGQSWLVLELTGSPFRLGLIGTLQFAPMLVFALVGGVLGDRFPRRRLLVGTQTALMLQALALSALAFTGHVQYWHVAVLAGLYGLANAIDLPVRQSFVADLVGRRDLVNAVALNSAVFNAARVVGPAAAGLLVARYGTPVAFLLNGVSFIGVILALLAIRTEGRSPHRSQASIVQQVAEAVRYAAGTPRIALVLGLVFSVSLFALNQNVLVPLVARDALGEGAHGFGLLMASLGAGAVTGAVALAAFSPERPPIGLIVGAAAGVCAGLLVLAEVGRFAVAAAVLSAVGLAQIVFMASCNTTVQMAVPDELRGRMMALYSLVFVGVAPFGAFLVGSVAEAFGVRAACAAGGGLGLLAVGALAIAWRRRARPAPVVSG